MSRWNDNSEDIRKWTNAKLMDEYEARITKGLMRKLDITDFMMVEPIRNEIRRRFIRNPNRR